MKSRNRKASVVILQGSPRRKGNTAALAGQVAKGAVAAGAEVASFYLQGMRIAPCTGCGKCRQPGARGCVIRDDMHAVYAAARSADVIVFASPIYWFTVSAQLKAAMDRFYAFLTPKGHLLAGKRIGLVFTFEGDDVFDAGCVNAIRTFQDAFAFIGSKIVGMVYGRAGDTPGSISANRPLMRQARDLGRTLVRG